MRSMIKREYKHSLEKQAFFSNFNNIIHFPDRVGWNSDNINLCAAVENHHPFTQIVKAKTEVGKYKNEY